MSTLCTELASVNHYHAVYSPTGKACGVLPPEASGWVSKQSVVNLNCDIIFIMSKASTQHNVEDNESNVSNYIV